METSDTAGRCNHSTRSTDMIKAPTGSDVLRPLSSRSIQGEGFRRRAIDHTLSSDHFGIDVMSRGMLD